MPYKVEVQTDDTGQWYGNGLTFDTEQEAKRYALDLAAKWILVLDFRVVQATD